MYSITDEQLSISRVINIDYQNHLQLFQIDQGSNFYHKK